MKFTKMVSILGVVCVAITMISCTRVKEQLSYPNTEFKEYVFGKNNEIFIKLPTPVLGSSYYLYSNYLRWEWIGSGFANYYTMSDIIVKQEKKLRNHQNTLAIRLNKDPQDAFIMSRCIELVSKNCVIEMLIITSIYPRSHYLKETLNSFVLEDNELFEKILKTIRIKRDDGKYLMLKVNYEMLRAKMHEIYFTPNQPHDLFEIPYELVEETTFQPPVTSKK